jgi:hypothetical protein
LQVVISGERNRVREQLRVHIYFFGNYLIWRHLKACNKINGVLVSGMGLNNKINSKISIAMVIPYEILWWIFTEGAVDN